MNAEALKLEIMIWIGELSDNSLLNKIYSLKKKTATPIPPTRKPGWGKNIFLFVAPDFDATPEGFEEYMPTA